MLGAPASVVRAVDEGGYSPSGRWVVEWDDGERAFVKACFEAGDRRGLALECDIQSRVQLGCVPQLLAWRDGGAETASVLVSEDLSDARWGIPVTVDDARHLSEALDSLEQVQPPGGLPRETWPAAWESFRADPGPLIASGLAGLAWVEASVETLAAAEASVDPRGDRLIHTDLWRQNWCCAPRGAVLVDWASGALGNPAVSRAWAEAGVRSAGGPAGVVMPHGNAGWAAWMAGRAAWFLVHQPFPDPPERLLETERREAVATLGWACDELDLQRPRLSGVFAQLGPWRP